MSRRIATAIAAIAATTLILASAAAAQAPEIAGVDPARTLQSIVDARYGVGHVDVATDYIGARPGDIDPWFWVGDQFSAYLIHDVTGKHSRGILAWYEENGVRPEFPGGGIVFDASDADGSSAVISFSQSIRFGFMLAPKGGQGPPPGLDKKLIFTNRLYNDLGPGGEEARHAPKQGDVRALVFDVSRWSSPNTWLVCFEDHEPGAGEGRVEPEHHDKDSDDMMFEVTALGATPVKPVTFGSLKESYRH